MGMFDNIRCEYPLPGLPDDAHPDWQSKSLDCAMGEYTITAGGLLVHHTTRMEAVPEEQRPYFGTPKWDGALGKLFGSMRVVPTGDVVLNNFTGAVNFYDDIGGTWYEYTALYQRGKLLAIERMSPGEDDENEGG